MSDIAITLPDGSERTLPEGATGTDLASSIGKRLAKDAVVVEVNGEPTDLAVPLHDGDAVRIVTVKDDEALEHLRHSTAHVLAQAVLKLWPGATFAGGPAIADGFYYDFELPDGATFSEEDLERIDAEMRRIISANQPFERFELPVDEGQTGVDQFQVRPVVMIEQTCQDRFRHESSPPGVVAPDPLRESSRA